MAIATVTVDILSRVLTVTECSMDVCKVKNGVLICSLLKTIHKLKELF